MKKSLFMTLFFAAQVGMIVLQINKHSKRIQLLYEKQKNESVRNALVIKRQELTQQLYASRDRAAIKEYATNHLNMKPVRLDQIKKAAVVHDQQNV